MAGPGKDGREGLAQQTCCYGGQLKNHSRLTVAIVLEGVRPGHTCPATRECRRCRPPVLKEDRGLEASRRAETPTARQEATSSRPPLSNAREYAEQARSAGKR